MQIPQTLFARTALILATALILLLILSLLIFGKFVMEPVARQASEDASALLMLSAQTWAELPPDTRTDFEEELVFSHGIYLSEADAPLVPVSDHSPYLEFLNDALAERIGSEVEIGVHEVEEHWFDVDIPVGGRVLRLGFSREKFVPELPQALFWLLLAAAVLTMLTTLLLVRHLTKPLASLSDAAVRFGQGASREKIEEKGPEELKALTRSFNTMTVQLNELMENRTTLLAGISHDLRTPIARLLLALEMLPPNADEYLQKQMKTDLKEMDQLIARTLELARNMEDAHSEKDEVNLAEFLDGIVAEYSSSHPQLKWKPGHSCHVQVNVVALRRVVINLIENALRYGGDEVDVRYKGASGCVQILVLDRGPGIGQEHLQQVFQPFHRLESSRNQVTGGSGLGLAIVQQLCHGNHWEISLRNREGGGLEAKVTIAAESSD